jgi:hypothetical protein
MQHSMHSMGASSCPFHLPDDIYPWLTLPVNGELIMPHLLFEIILGWVLMVAGVVTGWMCGWVFGYRACLSKITERLDAIPSGGSRLNHKPVNNFRRA